MQVRYEIDARSTVTYGGTTEGLFAVRFENDEVAVSGEFTLDPESPSKLSGEIAATFKPLPGGARTASFRKSIGATKKHVLRFRPRALGQNLRTRRFTGLIWHVQAKDGSWVETEARLSPPAEISAERVAFAGKHSLDLAKIFGMKEDDAFLWGTADVAIRFDLVAVAAPVRSRRAWGRPCRGS